jgi:hypothetical protein
MTSKPSNTEFDALELSIWESEGGRPRKRVRRYPAGPKEHPRDQFGDDLSIPREPVDDDEVGGEGGGA